MAYFIGDPDLVGFLQEENLTLRDILSDIDADLSANKPNPPITPSISPPINSDLHRGPRAGKSTEEKIKRTKKSQRILPKRDQYATRAIISFLKGKVQGRKFNNIEEASWLLAQHGKIAASALRNGRFLKNLEIKLKKANMLAFI